MKNRSVLIPNYMRKFSCIGTSCEDNCCYGWKVDINEKMYKKYKKIINKDLKILIDKNITRNRSNSSSRGYAKIKMNSNGDCPFLCEDKLCNMHRTLGPEYLSDVCMTYPRVTNLINDVVEKSATLSCPEAARLALLEKNPMEFDEIFESFDVKTIVKLQINTNDIRYSNKVVKYLWNLRIFSISLLQNRNYNLWERLIILGVFSQKVHNAVNGDNVHSIPIIINEYNVIIEGETLKSELQNIPTNFAIQMELMKEFNDQRFRGTLAPNIKAYVQCVGEFLNGIQYDKESKVEEISERYEEAYLNYYKPFMEEHEYILENYLVNYVFKDIFPLGSKNDIFDDYVKLIVHYSLIKMILIGMSAYYKELNEEMIIKLIFSFSRAIEHSKGFLNKMFNLLKENGYNTMAYMAILIKN